jgi:hypothetical protein
MQGGKERARGGYLEDISVTQKIHKDSKRNDKLR